MCVPTSITSNCKAFKPIKKFKIYTGEVSKLVGHNLFNF